MSFCRHTFHVRQKISLPKNLYSILEKYIDKLPFKTSGDKNKEYYISKSGIICNSIIEDLFYSYSNMDFYSDLKYYEYRGLSDMVGVETTYISMTASKKSVEIIKSIIANFGGGWIDENDCDDDDYYYVDGNGNGKPVKHVTLEEVYEKFGEIVIIDR